jgi:hypothetical protein
VHELFTVPEEAEIPSCARQVSGNRKEFFFLTGHNRLIVLNIETKSAGIVTIKTDADESEAEEKPMEPDGLTVPEPEPHQDKPSELPDALSEDGNDEPAEQQP